MVPGGALDAVFFDSWLKGLQALGLAMARVLGCAMFLPAFGRRHMSTLHRNSICIAVSLPQTWVLWNALGEGALPFLHVAALGAKEALLGCMLGMLMAIPFWTLRGMGTLVDNQRGANAAQQTNPSLEADASILGELAERLLISFLIHAGLFKLIFDVLADSYAVWPPLDVLPTWTPASRDAILAAFSRLLADTILYAGPVLLVLLALEYALAIASSAIQGLEVYQTAMPIKTLLALLIMVLWVPAMLEFAGTATEAWWLGDVLRLLRP